MSKLPHGMSSYDNLIHECINHNAVTGKLSSDTPFPDVFGRLLPKNPITGNLKRSTILDAFDELVECMRTKNNEPGPADAGMTFFGQMVDHDITLDAQSEIGRVIDPRHIRNVRTPSLDLDCVYGDGPEASPHLYAQTKGHEGFLLFGRKGSKNDLARNCAGRALIGDPRNDENIIVSQLQGAFICLHNILMSMIKKDKDIKADVHGCAQMDIRSEVWDFAIPKELKDFQSVRRFMRLHYQWLVLNCLLPAFVSQDVIDAACERDPFGDKGPTMPVEFSVAAYRFGHATVQPEYTLRANEKPVHLFEMSGFKPRSPKSTIEFSQFFSGTAPCPQRALPVGTKMADTLFDLPDNIVSKPLEWDGKEISLARSKKLALRNILRDRTSLLLPSGQKVAEYLKIKILDTPKALTKHAISKTPLWFYCLQEAEENGKGKLTGVGGSIVASVIIRLLKLDAASVWYIKDFTPWSGFGGERCSLGGILEFVEKNRNDVYKRRDLFCGPPTVEK